MQILILTLQAIVLLFAGIGVLFAAIVVVAIRHRRRRLRKQRGITPIQAGGNDVHA